MKYKKYLPLIAEEILVIVTFCWILIVMPGRFSGADLVPMCLINAISFALVNLFDYFGMPLVEHIFSGGGITKTLIIWVSQAIGYIGLFYACFRIGSYLSVPEPLESMFCLSISFFYTAFHYLAFLIMLGLGKKRIVSDQIEKEDIMMSIVNSDAIKASIEDRKEQWIAFTGKLQRLMKENPSLPVLVAPGLGMIRDRYDCRIADFHNPESHELLFQVILIHDKNLEDEKS